MKPERLSRFLYYLQHELQIPGESISLALQQEQQSRGPLPMILWQYGLITLSQLDLIFDWLERSSASASEQ
jgi:Protein of unknown function (DUF2949)